MSDDVGGMLSQKRVLRHELLDLKLMLNNRMLAKRRNAHTVILEDKSDALKHANYLNDFTKQCEKHRVVGFDCKWIGANNKVCLMQLAEPTGRCVIVRLCKVGPPLQIVRLLGNSKVLKMGVRTQLLAKRLEQDHTLRLVGWVDVRHLARRYRPAIKQLELLDLAKWFLSVELDKDGKAQASDWEARELTTQQENFAANCCYVAVNAPLALTLSLMESSTVETPRGCTYKSLIQITYDIAEKHRNEPFKELAKRQSQRGMLSRQQSTVSLLSNGFGPRPGLSRQDTLMSVFSMSNGNGLSKKSSRASRPSTVMSRRLSL